jgi:dihydrolipoamide dehydrogenase
MQISSSQSGTFNLIKGEAKMTPKEQFDLAVIGGGPGGYSAAFRAAQLGMNTALIEVFKIGGVCLHAACIPYKALLENIRIINLFRKREEFGFDNNGEKKEHINFGRIMARKNGVVDRLHSGLQILVKKNKVTYMEGLGSITAPSQVTVRNLTDGTEQEIRAKNIIISTGSKPKFIPAFAADGNKVLFSDHVVDLPSVPKSLIILGGGPIGVETATVFNALGSEITIIEATPRIMINEDQEISAELEEGLKNRGIGIITGTKVSEMQRTDEGVIIRFTDPAGQEATLVAEKFLVAIGRDGLIERLGLEQAGVEVDRNFIKVDEKMQTNVPGIYAVGDVAGPPLLAAKAISEGVFVVENIAGKESPAVDFNKVPHCTYCEPQAASIGLTEQAAKEKGHDVKIGRFSFKISGKALCEGEEEGFTKVVADASTGEILGVHMIGHEVTELIMECSQAMFAESTVYELGRAIHAHPTRAEAVKEAALDIYKESVLK